MVWWVGVRAVHIWRRLRLRRLVRAERRRLRVELCERLSEGGGKISHRQIDLLARSFRLRWKSQLDVPHLLEREIVDATALLSHIDEGAEGSVTLVNSDSGYGKTILGIALPLLRSPFSRGELFPLYIDLAGADSREPLAELEQLLARLGGEKNLWGRPLFVFDALNETVDPEYFAEQLALRREELRDVHARMLFLFSFRHRSYPGRLRSALTGNGFGPIQNMELLFDLSQKGDLDFMPELVRMRGASPPPRSDIEADLRAYSCRFPAPPLSREDAATYLSWRYPSTKGYPIDSERASLHPSVAPSPASLCLTRTLGPARESAESFFPLARVAFLLLGDEVTATTYQRITEDTGIDEGHLRRAISDTGMHHLVHCATHHLRFEDETTVRVLGAVEVARQLIEGGSPGALRGRTTYDVCAPYLQPALKWLQSSGLADIFSSEQLANSLCCALVGPDGPYSFYAAAFCGDDSGAFGARLDELHVHLFEAMIAAIDEDRSQTCVGSLELAGSEAKLILDPVLDQLFEVMNTYGRRAVALLLDILEASTSLVRSQAAYLLVDWVDSVSEAPTVDDGAALTCIPHRMTVDDNLHVRFHQVELLECLLTLFPREQGGPHLEAVSRLNEIGSNGGDTGDLEGYSSFQELICLNARRAAGGVWSARAESQLLDTVRNCISVIKKDQGFEGKDGVQISEERLECWEVALGMAASVGGAVRQNADFVSFIEAALDHEYWIVRWWAFNGLACLTKEAAGRGDIVLAGRCVRRAVLQLCTGVEPMGLKHRQCSVIKGLRDADDEVGRIARAALAEAAVPRLSTPEGQALAERYYDSMGASPDGYLAEFFRRVDGLIVDVAGTHPRSVVYDRDSR
jgi:hypothetical protein